MNILFLRGCDNYFNRLVKKFLTLAEYRQHSASYVDWSNINFNPNDGITTELIVGGPTQLESNAILSWDTTGSPDYAIVYSGSTIISRWFITEAVRTRNGQYSLTFKRDVIADNIDELFSAPIFIEKGTITDVNNPLLYNKENMTYNQIKTREYLLKDPTKVAWIVGYIAKNIPESTTTVSGTISTMLEDTLDPADLPFDFDLDSEVNAYGPVELRIDLSVGTGQSTGASTPARWGYDVKTAYKNAYENYAVNTYESSKVYRAISGGTTAPYTYYKDFVGDISGVADGIRSLMYNFTGAAAAQLQSNIRAYFNEPTANLEDYRGRIVYDSIHGKYYRIDFDESVYPYEWTAWNPGGSTKNAILQYALPSGGYTTNVNYVDIYSRTKKVIVKYTEISGQTIRTSIGAGGTTNVPRGVVNDAVYDIFCLPYGDFTFTNLVEVENAEVRTTYHSRTDASLAIARAIAATWPSAVYDLQLLPYCPIKEIRDYYGQYNRLDIDTFDSKYWSLVTTSQNTVVSILLWATSSTGTFDIPLSIKAASQPINRKIENETKLTRLCSPNYAGIFEFSIAKNNGIDYINVDYTYKPHNPYIHLNPNFKGLYGQDWNDSRGLICGGDFTISSISDAWQEYQLQNKNFQNIFDRQIQNMDVNNSIAQEQQMFNWVTGSIMGGGAGAASGAMLTGGSIPGAIVGGAIGAGASIFGGAKDREWMLRQQGEAKSYAKDMFGYNLGNIQALPYSLSRSDVINANNKIWPFLEIYQSTNKEAQALMDKLTYNGMTIMAIGTLSDYVNLTSSNKTYLQGQLIRLDGFRDDSHVLNEIYNELNKGLYFIGSDIHLQGGN